MDDRQIDALPIARLDYDACQALRAAVSTSEHRAILNHVLVREGYAEACNGHVLCRTPLVDAAGEEFSLPVDLRLRRWLVHRAALAHVRSGHALEIDMQTGECWVTGKEGEEGYPIELPRAEVETVGQGFPNTDAVIPRATPEYRTVQLGAPILRAALAFAGTGKNAGAIHLLVPPDGENGYAETGLPFNRTCDGSVVRSGVLMPMRAPDGFEAIGGDAEAEPGDDRQQEIPGTEDVGPSA